MKILFSALLLCFSSGMLTSCGTIVDSLLDNDDDDDFFESRAKQERRNHYRTEGKPSFH